MPRGGRRRVVELLQRARAVAVVAVAVLRRAGLSAGLRRLRRRLRKQQGARVRRVRLEGQD